jgi:uncharacterized RDD family membrane protein YckC
LVFVPLGLLERSLSISERGPAILIIWSVLSYSAYWLYSVCLHARYGQTIGKMITRVKVLDRSERRVPTIREAFLRDTGYIRLSFVRLCLSSTSFAPVGMFQERRLRRCPRQFWRGPGAPGICWR